MATTNILRVVPASNTPPQISLADHAADYTTPTAANTLELGTPTNVQLDLTSLADTGYRQSAKFDFGPAWADSYSVKLAMESGGTPPTVSTPINTYFAESDQSTAANGNPGNLSGSDAAYTGYTTGTAAEAVAQILFLGAAIVSDETSTVMIMNLGVIRPRSRYGIIVINNETGQAFEANANEMCLVLTPSAAQAQAAV